MLFYVWAHFALSLSQELKARSSEKAPRSFVGLSYFCLNDFLDRSSIQGTHDRNPSRHYRDQQKSIHQQVWVDIRLDGLGLLRHLLASTDHA